MKKLLFILVSVVCLLSCRSVKNESTLATHHYSSGADTLAAVSLSERRDSTNYYHGVIDSLATELRNVRQMYRNLYVQDSINENLYKAEKESIKDTTWMELNPDGSVTYHHYREKNVTSHQQLERYRQQIVKESKATIDSLIKENAHLQAQYDSVHRFKSIADSLSIYKAKLDSISDSVNENEKEVVEKFSFLRWVKTVGGTIIFCVIVVIIILVYLKFFRR